MPFHTQPFVMIAIEFVSLLRLPLTLVVAFALCPFPSAAQISIPVQSDMPDMKAIADGNFLVTLDGGKLMNVEVKEGKATCVKSSDPQMKGMQGFIRNLQSGVFLIRFENQQAVKSQFWIFRKDGTAGVRELPDMGELQSAVPVKGDSLTPPKKIQ